jgi:hypothetical protein
MCPNASNLSAKLGVAWMLALSPEQRAGNHKCDNESNNDQSFHKRVMLPNVQSSGTAAEWDMEMKV